MPKQQNNMAYLYNKIAKSKNIIYYHLENYHNSKNAVIIGDFHKHPYKFLNGYYEEPIAWIDKKSGSIEWNEVLEPYIEKDIIKLHAINSIIKV